MTEFLVQTSLPTKNSSFIASVSAEKNVGYFKNMRRECQVKTFDRLGRFSYVCRMIRFSEPNTKDFEQRVFDDSALKNMLREVNTMSTSSILRG